MGRMVRGTYVRTVTDEQDVENSRVRRRKTASGAWLRSFLRAPAPKGQTESTLWASENASSCLSEIIDMQEACHASRCSITQASSVRRAKDGVGSQAFLTFGERCRPARA